MFRKFFLTLFTFLLILITVPVFSAEQGFRVKENAGLVTLKDIEFFLPGPLGEVSFNGRERARYEAWDYFAASTDNDYEFGGNQLRLGVKWNHPIFNANLTWQYTQLSKLPTKTSPGAGSGSLYFSNSLDRNSHGQFIKHLSFDLKDVWKTGLRASIGRFNYSSGNEMKSGDKKIDWVKSQRVADRLLGGFEWSHYGRSFDGWKVVRDDDWNQVSVAGFSSTQGGFEERAGRQIQDIDVIAVEANIKKDKLIPGMEEQFFYYHYDDHRNIAGAATRFDNTGRGIAAGTESDIEIDTFGGHFIGAYKVGDGVWDVLGWAAVQTGNWFNLDHEAYAFAAETGYQFNECPWKPWIRTGFNYGSGDDDPKDKDHGTFYQMLPTARLYSSSILYNMMNNEDLFFSIILKPLETLTVRSEYHMIELSEKKDRWYLGSGAMHNNVLDDFAARASSNAHDLGDLWDISVSWVVNPDVTVNVYYGHFFSDTLAKKFFPQEKDANFAYAEFVFNF